MYLRGFHNPYLTLSGEWKNLGLHDDTCSDVPAWWLLKKNETPSPRRLSSDLQWSEERFYAKCVCGQAYFQLERRFGSVVAVCANGHEVSL